MRVRRSLAGIAVFEVHKDIDVVEIDLMLAGMRITRPRSSSKYSRYYLVLEELTESLGIDSENAYYKDYVCYYNKTPLLCRLLVTSRRQKVSYVILASFQTKILPQISRVLLRSGWRKTFLFEMATRRHSPWRAVG